MTHIDVTVNDEGRLVAAYREHLRHEARRIVADHPDRGGKHYARVTFPPIRHETLYGCEAELKVEFV